VDQTRTSRASESATPQCAAALAKVNAELARYDHALMKFSAREKNGAVELVIEMKDTALGVHTYYAPLHQRDIDHPQFPWTLQRYLYDCLHDYVVEMFTRTPQSREQ
jgi:hypothetical protein